MRVFVVGLVRRPRRLVYGGVRNIGGGVMRALSSSSPFFCLARALISWRIFLSLITRSALSLSLSLGGWRWV